ncbi:MAG: hypothetical protein V2I43_10670 [Parvularcula sp.]|jgi:hypothetical protein|nr:hypothetical protein [Parvularcula sp.]
MRRTQIYISVIIAALLSSQTLAQSQQCTVPNTLANGEVADATDVMDNFDAIAGCVDETRDTAVTHEGTPEPGEIAVFSSTTGITSGNLSGDVTTSGDTNTLLSATGVTPGTYVNATITVDAKGRVTFAKSGTIGGGGAGTLATEFGVITPGDDFIDVKLDNDDGYAYRVLVKGRHTSDGRVNLRLSNDNGTTFFDDSGYYKSHTIGSASAIDLTNGRTADAGRTTIAQFTLAGMNVVATEQAALTGTAYSVDTSTASRNNVIGGHINGVVNKENYNAFRLFVTGGTMDEFSVFVERVY